MRFGAIHRRSGLHRLRASVLATTGAGGVEHETGGRPDQKLIFGRDSLLESLRAIPAGSRRDAGMRGRPLPCWPRRMPRITRNQCRLCDVVEICCEPRRVKYGPRGCRSLHRDTQLHHGCERGTSSSGTSSGRAEGEARGSPGGFLLQSSRTTVTGPSRASLLLGSSADGPAGRP